MPLLKEVEAACPGSRPHGRVPACPRAGSHRALPKSLEPQGTGLSGPGGQLREEDAQTGGPEAARACRGIREHSLKVAG